MFFDLTEHANTPWNVRIQRGHLLLRSGNPEISNADRLAKVDTAPASRQYPWLEAK